MDTQNQANPWISDKSFGSVGHALQCAEEIGVIRKGALLDDEERVQDAYESLASLKMIALQRQIRQKQKELDEVNLEIQRRLLDRDTRDITHVNILEQRIAKVNELNSHLEQVISNKQQLMVRLQQPFVNDYLPVELQYQRYGSELLPKLVPSLSGLSTNLENIEWLMNLNSTVGDLGGLLADLSSTLATLQSVVQSIMQVRGVVRQMKAQSGHSADILSASSVTDRHQSLS